MKLLLINSLTLLAMLTFVLVEIKASDDEYEQWLNYAIEKYGESLSESLKNQMRKFYDARKNQTPNPGVSKTETNSKNEKDIISPNERDRNINRKKIHERVEWRSEKDYRNENISKRTVEETDRIFHHIAPELKGRKLSIGKNDEKYRELWMDIYLSKVVGKKQEEPLGPSLFPMGTNLPGRIVNFEIYATDKNINYANQPKQAYEWKSVD
jgi:hypothetical protein